MRKAKKEKERKKSNKEEANVEREREKGERENKMGDFPGVLTVREEKLIHASRATRGYQNLGISSSSTR